MHTWSRIRAFSACNARPPVWAERAAFGRLFRACKKVRRTC
ncbi:hypothetical protein [Pseudomonas phage vB_Pa-PAC1]